MKMLKFKFKVNRLDRKSGIRVGSIIELHDENIGWEEFEITKFIDAEVSKRSYTKVFGIKIGNKNSLYLFKEEEVEHYKEVGSLRIKLY